MALTPEQIEALFRQSDGTFLSAGRAIEAEVRKDDEALIRQMLEALETAGIYPPSSQAAIAAARARLKS